jgi:predicted CXXCH cytochrome family protein
MKVTFKLTIIVFTLLAMPGLYPGSTIYSEDSSFTDSSKGGDTETAISEKRIQIKEGASCIAADCHSTIGSKKYVHAVGVNGLFCTRCHEFEKTGEHRFKKMPEITKPVCARCHSEEFGTPEDVRGMPSKVIKEGKELKQHKPFAEGRCTACHDAHQSDYFRHLKYGYPSGIYATFSPETYGLCLHCHKNFAMVLTEPRTLELTNFRNGNLNLHFRHVNKSKGRVCTICHNPHESANDRLIKDNFMFGNRLLTINFELTETGGKCAPTCHRKARYDRYRPVFNMIKTSPRPGKDATLQELNESMQRDMKKKKESAEKKQNPSNTQEEHDDKSR